jgi:AcrR family transcriptional regulator
MAAANDWLAADRNELAAERILDAAAELFVERGVDMVGMGDIAKAAGCSRATLYRYFENREALHTAYVHRAAYAVYHRISDRLRGIDDPQKRLVEGFTTALSLVRKTPPLASWFATTQPPLGGEYAAHSAVIKSMTAAFLGSLGGGDDTAAVERRALWSVRVITSLLQFPAANEADERALIEEFVLPVVAPGAARSANPSLG